jgi:hypothetical protein
MSKIFIKKLDRKWSLGKPRHRQEENTKVDLKKRVEGVNFNELA